MELYWTDTIAFTSYANEACDVDSLLREVVVKENE